MRYCRALACWTPLRLLPLLAVIGCGGGEAKPEPTPTPVPRPTTTFVNARVAHTEGIDYPPLAVVLDWDTPVDVPDSSIVEYHVYRNDELIDASINQSRNAADRIETRTFTYQEPGPRRESKTRTTSPLPLYQPNRYRITVLAGDDRQGYTETPLTPGETTVTPFLWPTIATTSLQWSSNKIVNVLFNASLGADRYVLELSDSPTFTHPYQRGPLTFEPLREGEPCYVFYGQSTDSLFSHLKPGENVYVRIGAASSHDSPDSVGNPRYLYSSPQAIPIVDGPLLPP